MAMADEKRITTGDGNRTARTEWFGNGREAYGTLRAHRILPHVIGRFVARRRWCDGSELCVNACSHSSQIGMPSKAK